MKNIVFVHGGDILKSDTPCSEKAVESYEWLFSMGRERGFRMVWTCYKYFENGTFTAYVEFDPKKQEWVKQKKTIKPDYLYDKAFFRYKHIPLKEKFSLIAPTLNPPQLQVIDADKMVTFLTFKEHMVPSYLVRNQDELAKALKKIKTAKVVLKTPLGLCGQGVHILKKSEAKKFVFKKPHLVQRFTDSKKGVPGLFKGVHDLRLVFLSNKLVQAYIRTAPKGELKSNIAQGGERIFVPIAKVPKRVKEIAKTFQKRFAQFDNSLYSVDFMYENGKTPYVVEINSNPTFEPTPGHEREVRAFFTKLLDHIESYV